MAPSAPLYDLTLLLDTAAPEEQRAKVLADVEAMIGARGDIVGTHDWGTRALAYEIRHKADAEYHLIQFHAPPELLADLQRCLRITDAVVRSRIIKLRAGTPAPVDPPRVERPAAAEAAPAPS
jgi:small subunit ribosomal protein S6